MGAAVPVIAAVGTVAGAINSTRTLLRGSRAAGQAARQPVSASSRREVAQQSVSSEEAKLESQAEQFRQGYARYAYQLQAMAPGYVSRYRQRVGRQFKHQYDFESNLRSKANVP